MSDIRISLSIFNEMSGKEKGGALFVSNFPLFITCCSFYKCKSTANGGAVYTYNDNVHIYKSSFNNCFVTSTADSSFGNAIYCYLSLRVIIKELSAIYCAPDKHGDSMIASNDMYNFLSNFNSTKNFDVSGCSLFCCFCRSNMNFVKYSQTIDCTTCDCLETRNGNVSISYVNVVNFVGTLVFWMNAIQNGISIDHCLFFSVTAPTFANYDISISDCYSNANLATGIVKVSDQRTHAIFFNNCHGTRFANTCKRSSAFIFFMIILLC